MPKPPGEFLTAVLDSIPLAVISLDLEGRILFVNDVAATNLDCSREAAVGTSVYEYFEESAGLAARERIRQTATFGTARHFASQTTLPDGTQRSFESIYCPSVDPHGMVSSIQILARDVTAARENPDSGGAALGLVPDDLSRNSARIRAIVENAPMMVTVFDTDMTIRYTNIVLRDVDPAEVIGRGPMSWLHEDSRSVFREAFDRLLRTKEVTECEALGRSERSWFVRLAPLIHDGEVNQVIACTLDVTEQRQLQARLAQSQKAESLGTMARGIAHDFNNLLTTILSYTGLARREAAAGLDIGELLDEVEEASQRAAGLCEQMLVYTGADRRSAEPSDLNAVIREMTPLTRAAVTAKIRVIHDLTDALPATRCNVAQLGQVYLNLINNAADAIGGEQGHITVTTDTVVLEHSVEQYHPKPPRPGRYVRMQIADSGHGIAPESRDLIFDPFYSTKTTGHGLGLSVVLGIVAAHDAAIAVDCGDDGGTRMTVLFTAHEEAPIGSEAKPAESPWSRGDGRVLVVDDEASVRRSVARVLTTVGYDVLQAEDGDAALEVIAAQGESVRAVVLDVTMPGRDGYSTLAALRQTDPRLPVLLSSGKPMELERADPYVVFLPKPYTPQRIIELLAEVIAHGSSSPGAQ